ncbi:hypothetical protein BGW36DRAFT_433347 [Talaromyces proteolyticus]|uniref:Xylanolytic transcriptional activator regulatory domain-containing protein n=1 Tax=Talaromyces proteolyticus TaxID=1131652 RepID=A0AAD4PTU9_9EURO|nr:uncharacterized protein BGW36DRAFT_433347 [Talaromyces proteolyticus]KAH8689341.1 hypothetical protein BGW36DRAFT_433347 [Talaromyces proteolyticus]
MFLQFVHEQPCKTGFSELISEPKECNGALRYHDGTNPITILNETLGSAAPNQLLQEGACRSDPSTDQGGDKTNLCNAGVTYLRQEGAWTLPPQPVCNELLRLFFQSEYLCVPVFDRVKFVTEYLQQTVSMFLLQAVLASAVSYASVELLNAAGFQDHSSAQETFFTRAKLLYDFDVEKSQLRLLQGSLILSTTHVSHYMSRDYRFWISNAVCIATKMGLHRRSVRQRLHTSAGKLLRRIWWTLYTWDAVMALNGMDTIRRFYDTDHDASHLTEADWEEEIIPSNFQDLLHPFTSLEKSYMIESSRLSLIIVQFWQKFATTPLETCCNELEVAIQDWRESLPHLRIVNTLERTSITSWHLILLARSYICESIMYRMIKRSPSADKPLIQRATQMIENVMFDLDKTLEKIMSRDNGQFNSWLIPTFVSTAFALHVERVLDPTTSDFNKILATLHIQAKLEFLREMSKTWSYIGALVKIFEDAIRSANISVPLPKPQQEHGIVHISQGSPDALLPPNKQPDLGSYSWFLGLANSDMSFDFPIGSLDTTSMLDEFFSDNSHNWNSSQI